MKYLRNEKVLFYLGNLVFVYIDICGWLNCLGDISGEGFDF